MSTRASGNALRIVVRCIVAWTIAAAGARAQAPAKPTKLTVIPDYGATQMLIEWRHDGKIVRRYDVERKEEGGTFARIASVNAPTMTAADVGPFMAGKEYVYRVRAAGPGGNSPYSDEFQQNFKIVYITPGSDEILHGWNDTIGDAAVDIGGNTNGFHEGVDFQRPTGATMVKVVALRGGVVKGVSDGPNGNVSIEVKAPGGAEFDETSHLAMGVKVKKDDVVRAGQQIGEIDETHFPVNFTDHVHFAHAKTLFGAVLERHPLRIFAANAQRDPKQKKPALADHAGTPVGSLLVAKHGQAATVYDKNKPLSGDVDLIVEVVDEMGTNPDQLPVRLGYWIEPPRTFANPRIPSVKSKEKPYVLFDFTNAWFGKGQTTLAFSEKVVLAAQDHGPKIMEGGETYPWPNLKHYIVTHAKGESGAVADVDDGQYWRTNAKNDKPSPDPLLNYAGKTTTTKAEEARFPDGEYRIHVLAWDVVNSAIDVTDKNAAFVVRLENYPPVVRLAEPTGSASASSGMQRGLVFFNEDMDTGVNAATLVAIQPATASIANAKWDSKSVLTFDINGVKKGVRHTVTISKNAKDLPGTPGGNLLDGNKDGVAGDDFSYDFFGN